MRSPDPEGRPFPREALRSGVEQLPHRRDLAGTFSLPPLNGTLSVGGDPEPREYPGLPGPSQDLGPFRPDRAWSSDPATPARAPSSSPPVGRRTDAAAAVLGELGGIPSRRALSAAPPRRSRSGAWSWPFQDRSSDGRGVPGPSLGQPPSGARHSYRSSPLRSPSRTADRGGVMLLRGTRRRRRPGREATKDERAGAT